MAIDSDFEQNSDRGVAEEEYDEEYAEERDSADRKPSKNIYGLDEEQEDSQGSELEDPELSELSEDRCRDSLNSQSIHALIQHANTNERQNVSILSYQTCS